MPGGGSFRRQRLQVPTVGSALSASGGDFPDRRPRVLVVEDEALVAIEISHVLTDAGFDVLGPAGSVPAALALLERSRCDVALLDINLGSMTSEAVAVRLKGSGTPFVILSGYSRDQYPPAFTHAPALTKPLRHELLIAELKKCTKQKQSESI